MDYKKQCSSCKPQYHCCIFKNNPGFVFVSLSDAARIRKKTGKDYSYFLDYSKLPKNVVAILKNGDPAEESRLRYSQLRSNRLLRMKKKDSRCVFFNGKCSIYQARPNICRIYPFWAVKLTNGKLKVITRDAVPRCKIAKAICKNDVEDILTKKEIAEIKEIFKKIKKEKNIALPIL